MTIAQLSHNQSGLSDGISDNVLGSSIQNMERDVYKRQNLALEALRACIDCGVVFEVNTGAMARKMRLSPYPADFLLEELCRLGGKVTLSADCHRKDLIISHLYASLSAVKNAGVKTVSFWENGKFIEKEI